MYKLEQKEGIKMDLKIYDKAQWHIDNGMEAEGVIKHFVFIFNWLNEFNLLSSDGIEMLDIGIDSSISLNEKMVNISGKNFLEKNYDKYISLIDYGKTNNSKLL